MTNQFMVLLRMLKVLFEGPTVSEDQYHDVITCMRRYDTDRVPVETEQAALLEIGYPVTYHPCDHMERIRFCTVFGKPSANLKRLLDAAAK